MSTAVETSIPYKMDEILTTPLRSAQDDNLHVTSFRPKCECTEWRNLIRIVMSTVVETSIPY